MRYMIYSRNNKEREKLVIKQVDSINYLIKKVVHAFQDK